MSELLPCPFCNNRDVDILEISTNEKYVACGECGAEGPTGYGDKAVAQWNKRNSPPGWQLVPKQHDINMSIAHGEAFYSKRRAIDDDDIQDLWGALLTAAPRFGEDQ